jgi:outer membrane receptor for ferrienterochelin and colicin
LPPSVGRGLPGAGERRDLLDLPFEGLLQVEIIRGPMSVIEGSNPFLGVVNIVTNIISHALSSGRGRLRTARS